MPAKLEFHGIFRRHDVGFGGIQPGDGRIQGVGLAGTGGPGHQDHSVGTKDGALEFGQGLGLEAELGHVQSQVLFVEQAHDDLFAVEGRNGGNAEVEVLDLAVLAVLDHDAAVLRQAAFR